MSEARPAGPALMPLLVRSILLIGTAVAGSATRRLDATFAGYLAAALLAAVSLGFFTFSGYRAVAQSLGDVYAGLLAGVAYLLLAMLALIVLQAHRR